MSALSISGLGHSFGERKALDGVAVEVADGELAVLLGLNGAGKSTLFALTTRLYAHRVGTIRIFGEELNEAPGRALAALGIVFQQPTLDLDLTVEQNLRYHAALHGIARAEAKRRIGHELDRVGLADRADEKARRLSGGQRRRVEIARALLHRPRLLLLDEPTVGLDVESRRFLIDHVRRLCREERLAALWATHLLDEAEGADRVIVLHRGKVLAAGGPELARDFSSLVGARAA